MPLNKLDIHNFRNLKTVSLSNLSPTLNLLYGENASGKTSFLEAIYCLGMGKSFRSKKTAEIIKHHEKHFTVFGALNKDSAIQTVGIEKHLSGDSKIKISEAVAKSAAELSELMPMQLLTPHIFHLMETGPEQKRKFMDWAVFHVEHSFLQHWRTFKRALKQRNALLKSENPKESEILLWNNELHLPAVEISKMRTSILDELFIIIKELAYELLNVDKIGLKLLPGWDMNKDYQQILQMNLAKDRLFGFTQYGPHRADIKIYINGKPAAEVLSRGQQKLLVSSMIIAQGIFLKQKTGKHCIYLLDDLGSELDKPNRNKLIQMLSDLGMQIFATCVENSAFEDLAVSSKLFHVEHGQISEQCIENTNIVKHPQITTA